MRFGIFLAPFHPVGQNPTLALERDLELIQHLDRLGFDEAWIGEHHSAGFEIIASPEVFIAVAAERTSHIKLGTGVNSLPYHHPLLLADRIVLLDHLTRGRAMLGCGPGQLTSDAHMLGIEPNDQRPRMDEALDALMSLLRGDEPVSVKTEWFELRDARLQLAPYSRPCFDIVVAASISPAGPRAAARHGLGLLSVGATSESGFDVLGQHWGVVEETAAEYGTTPSTGIAGASSGRCTWPRRGSRHGATSSSASSTSPTTSVTCCPSAQWARVSTSTTSSPRSTAAASP
jgi:limonene 1,2-monooxygenase